MVARDLIVTPWPPLIRQRLRHTAAVHALYVAIKLIGSYCGERARAESIEAVNVSCRTNDEKTPTFGSPLPSSSDERRLGTCGRTRPESRREPEQGLHHICDKLAPTA